MNLLYAWASRARFAFLAAVAALAVLLVPSTALAAACTGGDVLLNHNLLAADAAFVTFSSISPTGAGGCTYTNLRITGQARTTSSTCDSWLYMQVGSIAGGPANTLDTGSHYNWVVSSEYGGGYGHSQGYQDTKMGLATVPCSTRPTGAAATFEILIPNAFNATYDKDIIAQSLKGYNTNSPGSGAQAEWAGGVWAPGCAAPCNENAIDDVYFWLSSGSFKTGSEFYVWGQ